MSYAEETAYHIVLANLRNRGSLVWLVSLAMLAQVSNLNFLLDLSMAEEKSTVGLQVEPLTRKAGTQ